MKTIPLFFAILFLSLPLHATLIVNEPQPITDRVTIQVVMVADDEGLNVAQGLGTASEQSAVLANIDTIWAQAGIDTEFSIRIGTWNNSFVLQGNAGSGSRPTADALTIRDMATSASLLDPNPLVLNIFLVQITPGATQPVPQGANGIAFIGENVIIASFGSSIVTTEGGRENMANLLAHEIGHNLGLDHVITAENLMRPGANGERLDASQIQLALNSSFTIPIPEPSTGALFCVAACLASIWRRRNEPRMSDFH